LKISFYGIGCKTRVKFVVSHWSVSIRLLLVKLVGFRSVLLLVKLSRSVTSPFVGFVFVVDTQLSGLPYNRELTKRFRHSHSKIIMPRIVLPTELSLPFFPLNLSTLSFVILKVRIIGYNRSISPSLGDMLLIIIMALINCLISKFDFQA